jgi:prolyl-tRNA editing enzyme YbaK/EbsC (Cys-tRNA(Pro) deacylase)
MAKQLSAKAAHIQNVLAGANLTTEVRELNESTRTAAEAAAALGCAVAQIAKSIIFATADTDEAILVIASGVNRVDEKKIAELIGHPIKKATPEFVVERTGFVIGGVPPLGHAIPIKTFIDEDIFQYDIMWAAAGTGRSLFSLTPADLKRVTGGQVGKISIVPAQMNI